MKELTIEEKAKRYDEALADAKHYYEELDSDTTKNVLEEVFSELKESKESENERIRKAISQCVEDMRGQFEKLYSVHHQNAIDWLEKQGKIVEYYEDKLDRCACENFNKGYKKALEKQGEHANFLSKIQIGDKVTRNEDGILVNLSQLKRVAKPEITDDCEIDSNDDGLVAETIKYKHENQDEQKSAWSKDDEKERVNTIIMLKEGASIRFNKKDITTAVDWLKSIKHRNTWKPSEEQMRCIKDLIDLCEGCDGMTILESLYNDLKQL